MSTGRRLLPEQSRAQALEAARDLLLAEGPQAVTLKAVAARVGRTHANLLHHFGSALGLQKALIAMLADRVCADIAVAVARTRRGEIAPRVIVDMTFDAFDSGGAGALATWMITTGNRDALDPILTAVHRLVDEIGAEDFGGGHDDVSLHRDTLNLVLMALGDALLGQSMAAALGLPRDAARQSALDQLLASPSVAARLRAVA